MNLVNTQGAGFRPSSERVENGLCRAVAMAVGDRDMWRPLGLVRELMHANGLGDGVADRLANGIEILRRVDAEHDGLAVEPQPAQLDRDRRQSREAEPRLVDHLLDLGRADLVREPDDLRGHVQPLLGDHVQTGQLVLALADDVAGIGLVVQQDVQDEQTPTGPYSRAPPPMVGHAGRVRAHEVSARVMCSSDPDWNARTR
ncbi:hypothetical protein SMC26_39100 [Actinomadura fulvescens]